VDVSIVWQWVRQIEKPSPGGAALGDKLWSGDTCTVVMPHNICWVDELICSHQHITTDELCSILSFSKGSEMIVAEEVVCSKVFTQWVTRMLMDAYRETRLPLIFCTSMTLELRVSYHRLSCGLKPGSAILNLSQSGYWQIGATWYPNKEGEIQACAISWQVVGTFVWDETGFILVNLWPRGTTVNSNICTETLRILNAYLFQDCFTRKISEMLLNQC
jgi:hypothetical protein